LFPDIWDARALKSLESPDAARTLKAMDGWVSIIRQRDASFFDRFATEIQSGDHLRVERALDEAAQRLLDAAPSAGIVRPAGVYPGWVVVKIAIVALAIHQYVVVTYAVAALALAATRAAIPRGDDDASQFQRDVWVNDITKRLHRSVDR
jgi:SdpC family antimicrobial peptide